MTFSLVSSRSLGLCIYKHMMILLLFDKLTGP